MSDIASRAGVHRRTVYDYFPTKDALLAACFVRAISGVLEAAEPCWHTDEPFVDQVVNAMLVGLAAARSSPTMALLIGADELGQPFMPPSLRTLAKKICGNARSAIDRRRGSRRGS